jgi:hypothetical protein
MAAQAGAMMGIDTFYVSWKYEDFLRIPNGTCRPVLMYLNVKSWGEWITELKVIKELTAVTGDEVLLGHGAAKKKLEDLLNRSKELEEFVDREKVIYVKLLLELAADACDIVSGAMHGARFSTDIYTRGCHWFPRLLT